MTFASLPIFIGVPAGYAARAFMAVKGSVAFMFSKQNRRFLTLCTSIVLIAVGVMVTVSNVSSQNGATLASQIIGFGVLVAGQLIIMLRQEQQTARTEELETQHAQEIVKTRHDLKNDLTPIKGELAVIEKKLNGGIAHAIREEVAKAMKELKGAPPDQT